VDIAAVMPFKRPVTLTEVKAEKKLAEFKLVRQGRLSVVPASDAEWKLICAMGQTKA
jgi:predicted RNA-binding protein with PUA-like domain